MAPELDSRSSRPDRLALLEDERDFLLGALAALEDEHDAGEIDDGDYAALKDDYTRRAAAAMRSIEGRRAALAVAGAPRRRWRSGVLWLVGLALLGTLAGFAISRSADDRADGGTITGGADASVSGRLAQALQLFGQPDRWPDAIDLYDAVLAEQPSNVEAITYRAWLQYRSGADAGALLQQWEEATQLDPRYADAIVFRAIALKDLERYDEAAAVLDLLPAEGLSPMIDGLLAGQGLRGVVYGEARYDQITATEAPTLAELGLSVDVGLEVANYLLGTDKSGSVVSVLKLFRAVLAVDPDNASGLSRYGLLLAQASGGDPSLLQTAQDLLDRAVSANPDDAEALVSRATLYAGLDSEVACADLATFDLLELGADASSSALSAQAEQLHQLLAC
jgi:tetratricopeptide (TPR) repeat protein